MVYLLGHPWLRMRSLILILFLWEIGSLWHGFQGHIVVRGRDGQHRNMIFPLSLLQNCTPERMDGISSAYIIAGKKRVCGKHIELQFQR